MTICFTLEQTFKILQIFNSCLKYIKFSEIYALHQVKTSTKGSEK